MILGGGCKPVFQYKYRPLPVRAEVQDGGFCVTLYENGAVSFCTFGVDGGLLDEICFSLPEQMLDYLDTLIGNAESWLDTVPADLRAQGTPLYASSFAYDGHDPVRVWGMETLLGMPCNTGEGYYSRHLYVLFEDTANLFAQYGILMTMNSFTWDSSRVMPFRRTNMFGGQAQGMRRMA